MLFVTGKRFGRPIVFRTSRDVLLSELQSMVLSQMTEHLKNGVKYERMGSLFRLQVLHDALVLFKNIGSCRNKQSRKIFLDLSF